MSTSKLDAISGYGAQRASRERVSRHRVEAKKSFEGTASASAAETSSLDSWRQMEREVLQASHGLIQGSASMRLFRYHRRLWWIRASRIVSGLTPTFVVNSRALPTLSAQGIFKEALISGAYAKYVIAAEIGKRQQKFKKYGVQENAYDEVEYIVGPTAVVPVGNLDRYGAHSLLFWV